MSWLDRLSKLRYTSPSNRQFTLAYQDLSLSFDKKTEAVEFADALNTSLVRDFGRTANTYPLRVFISGPDYDAEAQRFGAALSERGFGQLEHPLYGIRNVVPFGTITQNDNLVTEANQASYDITFKETTDLRLVLAAKAPVSQVHAALDAANAGAVGRFSAELASTGVGIGAVPLPDFGAAITVKAGLAAQAGALSTLVKKKLTLLDRIKSFRDSVTNNPQVLRAQRAAQTVNAILTDIESFKRSLDVEIQEPLLLGEHFLGMLQSIAEAPFVTIDKINAYQRLVDSVLFFPDYLVGLYGAKKTVTFETSRLTVSGCIAGAVLAATESDIDTKTQALTVATQLIAMMDSYQAWAELGMDATGQTDSDGSDADLRQAVNMAAGNLVEISFSLQQEFAVILDRPRAIVDLAAQYYKDPDNLDFLIATNHFSGSEILTVPRGRRVVYFA